MDAKSNMRFHRRNLRLTSSELGNSVAHYNSSYSIDALGDSQSVDNALELLADVRRKC